MAEVELALLDSTLVFTPRSLRARERLGDSSAFDVTCSVSAPVTPADLVGQEALVTFRSGGGERAFHGVVLSAAAQGTADGTIDRRIRFELRSRVSVCGLRRRTRVFQNLSVPDVLKKVLEEGGYAPSNVVTQLSDSYSPREYLVQYAETDHGFVRRLCEEEGLFLRFVSVSDGERVIVEDDTTSAENALSGPLLLADATDMSPGRAVAFGYRRVHRMGPGKVTLRDYDQQKPALVLEAVKTGGTSAEQGLEVYEGPGRFKDPSEGATRATRRLESLRGNSRSLSFQTNAFALSPGLSCTLERAGDLDDGAPEGDFVVLETRHAWDGHRYDFHVEACPKDLRYRLPRTTPRPVVHGLHHAFVTTAAGEEIHVDDGGRVRLHFPWDREGPTDEKSSLPVRVMQPNTPGSMLNPRGGWEVLVAFEDGDPDRPYVVGRAFNAKAPPPYGLPANKTVTSLGTVSSPGGGKENRINFNDAAGSQNLAFLASFGKSTAVANNLLAQTVNNEDETVSSSQTRVIGADEAVSVTQAFRNTVGSQSATVGGMQKIFVQGDFTVGLGAETILIGGACLEKVGNPVSGLKNLATTAALEGAGALGIPVDAIMSGAAVVQAGIKGYQQGGFQGAVGAVGGAVAGEALNRVGGLVPGGDLLIGAVGGGAVGPWVEGKLNPGADASGGAASGGSDSSGAAGPGPGHRNTIVSGSMTEVIGGGCAVTSPGKVGWTTLGASTFLVGGSHTVRASTTGSRTLGAQTEVLGTYAIQTSGDITREIKGVLGTTIAGGLKSKAGGAHSIKAGAALSMTFGGALTMNGGTITFICGGSKLVATGGGVVIDTPSLTVTGNTKQTGINHK
jgi:type VI secretion system secreted protein VgrG